MLIEAPPSRYRVVERDGRLTVIDTLAKGPPSSAREIIAGGRTTAPSSGVAANQLVFPRRRPGSSIEPLAPGTRPSPGKQKSREAPDPAFSPRSPKAEPRPFLRTIAANLSGDVRDGSGRLMLSTASWIDAKGPRDIALSPAGEQSLGALCLAAIAGFIAIAVLLIAFPGLILPVLLIGGVAASQSRPFVTRAIDTLARL